MLLFTCAIFVNIAILHCIARNGKQLSRTNSGNFVLEKPLSRLLDTNFIGIIVTQMLYYLAGLPPSRNRIHTLGLCSPGKEAIDCHWMMGLIATMKGWKRRTRLEVLEKMVWTGPWPQFERFHASSPWIFVLEFLAYISINYWGQ